MLFVRTRDMTFTILASMKSAQMEELHHAQLAPEAVAAGTGTRAAVLSQPVIAFTECQDGSHHSVVYVALATSTSIYILDMRVEVIISAQSIPGQAQAKHSPCFMVGSTSRTIVAQKNTFSRVPENTAKPSAHCVVLTPRLRPDHASTLATSLSGSAKILMSPRIYS